MKFNTTTLLLLSVLYISCNPTKKAVITVNEEVLLANFKTLSSDAFEGRGFSTPGNYKAQAYVAEQFSKLDLEKVYAAGYIQRFPHTFSGKNRQRMFPIAAPNADFTNVPDTLVYGGNVLGKITGKTNKTIVITGHLDHLGIKNGKIYNGADDDASGTAALITIAEYFKQHPPKHTLIFAAVDAEETGSLGAAYFLENYTDSKNIVLNINMDMIAHNDASELYATGLYHYPQLQPALQDLSSPISLRFGHDDPNNKAEDDWTFSSDHRVFHKENIPFIYFGVEDHKDYHQPTDTYENSNPQFYIDAVKLITQAIVNFDEDLK